MNLAQESKEMKILKGLIKAQNKMLIQQRLGISSIPDWVFHKIKQAEKYYNAPTVTDIIRKWAS